LDLRLLSYSFHLKEMSQKINPISTARHPIVPINVIFNSPDSYFKCIKKRSTKVALKDAIKIAIQIFKAPISIREAIIVIAVRTSKAHNTAKSLG